MNNGLPNVQYLIGMNFSDLSKNQFVQESTLHGVSHLRYSKSKARTAFWLIVTILCAGYAGFEILREVKRISSGIEFETTYRLARIDEIEIPTLGYCYSHPFDIFDWKIVSAYMVKFNWTTEDVGHVLAMYPGFKNSKFKLMNVSEERANRLGNITSEIFKRMQRKICLNGKKSISMVETGYFMKTCISIICPFDSGDSTGLVVSHLLIRNNMLNKESSILRMSIINGMRKIHGWNLNTKYQDYLVSYGLYIEFIPLHMNSYNIIYVHPLKVNMPTTKIIRCYKQICNSQEQKDPCSNYSEMVLQERGIDCFHWQYRLSRIPRFSFPPWEKNPSSREFIGLILIYPPYQNWQVREHKLLFLWYQTLSNIGGTLSIWTGASVLSFLHLLEVFCFKCFRGRWKVGDSSQIAESVV